jgi:hypothetical protein
MNSLQRISIAALENTAPPANATLCKIEHQPSRFLLMFAKDSRSSAPSRC